MQKESCKNLFVFVIKQLSNAGSHSYVTLRNVGDDFFNWEIEGCLWWKFTNIGIASLF